MTLMEKGVFPNIESIFASEHSKVYSRDNVYPVGGVMSPNERKRISKYRKHTLIYIKCPPV